MKPNGNMWRLLQVLKYAGPMTTAEMCAAMEWNRTQVRTALDSLRARGIVELVGNHRTAKYAVSVITEKG